MVTRVKRAVEIKLLGPLLDAQTLKDENASRRRPNSFHASSIADCARKQYYGLKGFTPDPSVSDPNWKRDAATGTAMHDQYQSLLLRTGIVLPVDDFLKAAHWQRSDYPKDVVLPEHALEIPLAPNAYRIGGRIDAVVRLGDEDWIVDLKTVKSKAWEEMIPSHYKMVKYREQLQVYMKLTGIHRAAVVLICRNDSLIREFSVAYDDEWCTKTIERIAALGDLVKSNLLPQAEPNFFGCKFCSFSSLCAGDVNVNT